MARYYDPLTYPTTAAIPAGSIGRTTSTARFELLKVDGGFRWRLSNDDGRVIARGGTLYATPAAARSDI